MSQVFVLINQHRQFLSKNNEWVDGRESGRLFHSEHKDIAINQMFEANTRDIDQRIQLLLCPLNARGQPQLPDGAAAEATAEVDPDPQPQTATAEPAKI